MNKTLILKCRFCNKECGTYTYPSELSVADLKIADIRCDQHEAEFGSYSKMEQDFQGIHKDFLTTIAKAEYKRAMFDVEVQQIKDALITPKLGGVKLRKVRKSVIIKKK